MADVTAKALNLCSRLSDAADRLMRAVEDLSNLKDELESSGVDLTDAGGLVDAALAASSLKHATGVDFENVVSSGAAIKAAMTAAFQDDVMQRVRP
jgi:hypothetical protein